MPAPSADLEGVRLATLRLMRTIEPLTDEDAAGDSELPGWTRAEVLTHLARNADGFRRVAEAATRGEVGTMYPGGAVERADDIALGRGVRSAVVQLDVRRASDALMESWRAMPDDAWEREGQMLWGRPTVAQNVWGRWRELEVHHADLDFGYAPCDWPVTFARRGLLERLQMLASTPATGRGMHARVRVEASDLDTAWLVVADGGTVAVANDDGVAPVDAVVQGWSCDLLAWLYGRRSDGVQVRGEAAVLELPAHYPFG